MFLHTSHSVELAYLPGVPIIAKRFLFGAAALLAVVAVVLLCVNLYLQSGGVQQRIRAGAERALGSAVNIRTTTYTPWGGLNLRGLGIPDPTQPGRNIVEAEGLRVRFPLMPLLSQKFVVTEALLIQPTLVARQAADGNWILPLPRQAEKIEGPAVPARPSVKGPSFQGELRKIRLTEGTVIFIDSKGRNVLTMDKVDMEARIVDGRTVDGTFYIARMEISKSLKPNKIGGPFRWDGRTLDLPEIKGFLAGGTLNGSYHLETEGEPSHRLDAAVQGVLLRKLAEEASVEPGKTSGELQGTLHLAGDPRHSDSLNGKGQFELVSATLRPMEFLVKLGELFSIDELQLLKLHEANMQLTIADERVHVDNLILKSENLMISGTGPVRFNGKLNLEARLLVNQKLQKQLKGMLGDNFVESEFPDYRQLPFTVTGRIDSPKTDLLDKITGFKIGNEIPGLLKNLFQAIPQQKKKRPDGKAEKK